MNATTIPTNHATNKNNGNRSSSPSTIRTLGLTKIFPSAGLRSLLRFSSNRDGRIAVDDLNLTVPRGAIYGFLGPNGAGKTTTIKMLVGLLRPTRGTASICGHTVHDDLRRAQQHVGYVPDAIRKFPATTAPDFLTLFGEFSGLSKDMAKSRALDLLSWANLDEEATLKTKVGKWSAGMQRRLLFLQAMLHQPDVLILDEPTANLDPIARRELTQLIKQLTTVRSKIMEGNGWKSTVFLSSHDLPEVEEISTHLAFLDHGTLVEEGSKEKLHRVVKEACAGGATFTVTGQNLSGIAKKIEGKLQAKVLKSSEAKLAIITKNGDKLLGVLAEATREDPQVKITNMVQKEDNLEAIFLRLAELTRRREREDGSRA